MFEIIFHDPLALKKIYIYVLSCKIIIQFLTCILWKSHQFKLIGYHTDLFSKNFVCFIIMLSICKSKQKKKIIFIIMNFTIIIITINIIIIVNFIAIVIMIIIKVKSDHHSKFSSYNNWKETTI